MAYQHVTHSCLPLMGSIRFQRDGSGTTGALPRLRQSRYVPLPAGCLTLINDHPLFILRPRCVDQGEASGRLWDVPGLMPGLPQGSTLKRGRVPVVPEPSRWKRMEPMSGRHALREKVSHRLVPGG